jgi:hypothetical protein
MAIDGRAEGDKVARKLEELDAVFAKYDTVIDGDQVTNSVIEKLNKCEELKELLSNAVAASKRKNQGS